ncbi:MAG: hypothetical protein EOO67_18995, partial [Microbacterium sp.]
MVFQRARSKTLLAAVVLGAMAAGGTIATSAIAAPPYETDATLTSVTFVQETVASGANAKLTGKWSLPDDAGTPAGFVVDLPEGLKGLKDSFDLLDPDEKTMGHCVVTSTQIVCDLDSAYLAAHPRNVKGDFAFWAQVLTEVSTDTEVTYDFDDLTASVTVTPAVSSCPGCTFQGRNNAKSGTLDRETDVIRWSVDVASPATGFTGGQKVQVTERLGANQTWERTAADTPKIYVIGTNTYADTGIPTGWAVVDSRVGTTVEETADGVVVSFTAEEGWHYSLHGYSRITDGGAAETYTNEADIRIGDESVVPVRGAVVRQGGNGTGSG